MLAILVTLLAAGATCFVILSLSLAIGYFLLRIMGETEISGNSVTESIFGLCLRYVMGYGALGFILVYAYYLDVPRKVSNIALGMLFVLCLKDAVRRRFHRRLFEVTRTIIASIRSINKPRLLGFYYVMGFLLVAIYVPKIFIPWFDHDEMAVYGFVAKLIGNGWSYHDVLQGWKGNHHMQAMMVQSLDGMVLFLTGSTLAARTIRLMNLLWLGLALATFLRSLGVARRYCAAAFCGLLSIPELSLLATSLKTDSTVMLFEAIGILALTRSFLADDDSRALRWSALGVAFASFAEASRMSSLHLLALCILRFLYMIYKNWNVHAVPALERIVPFIFVSVGAISYMVNWVEYSNPLHPFSTALFNSGAYAESLDEWRRRYNIDLPAPLLQLYLLPHVALGWEVHPIFVKLEKLLGFSFLRTSHPVAISWLSPAMLVIFLAPLYLSLRAIRVLSLEFISLFVLWSLGIHYTRVFLAASLIPILMSGIIMGAEWPSKAKAWIARGVSYAFFLMILVLPFDHHLGQAMIVLRNYIVLPDEPSVFESNKRLLDNYADGGDLLDLTPRDIERIDAILETSRRPGILTATTIGRVLHIVFRNGLFGDMLCTEPSRYRSESELRTCLQSIPGIYSYVVVKRDSKIFSLEPRLRDGIIDVFPVVLYVSENGKWEFRLRSRV